MSRFAYWAMIIVPVSAVIVLYLIPIFNVLALSVTEPEFGFGNYRQLVENPTIVRVISTTIRICLITTVISVVLGYLLAYAMVHTRPGQREFMFFMVILAFWISILIRLYAWIVVLHSGGVINTLLMQSGITETPIALIRNEFGVILGMIHYMIPYAVLPIYANMVGIDRSLVPAARGMGAGRVRAFVSVFLPLSAPGIAAGSILVMIFSLGFYVTPAVLGGGRVVMLAEYIAVQISETLQWGLAAMLSSTLLVTVLCLTLAMHRFMDVKWNADSR
jgi:putative spermidine/putrescine transport system permease protein